MILDLLWRNKDYKRRTRAKMSTSGAVQASIKVPTKDELEEIDSLLHNVISPRVGALLKSYRSETIAEQQLQSNEETAELEITYLSAAKKNELLLQQYEADLSTEKEVLPADELVVPNKHRYVSAIEAEKAKLDKLLSGFRQKDTTHFYCDGELKAISKRKIKRWTTKLTNVFDMDPLQIHYRIAQSQFFRLRMNNLNFCLHEVEYIVNPELKERWLGCRKNMAERYSILEKSMEPLILFHGTSEESIEKIIKSNFDSAKISSNTGNFGAYGRGFYFSEFFDYSLGYCKGSYMLVCMVFVGRAYHGPNASLGKPLEQGYDAHVSYDGRSEVVIFNPDQILPCYRIKFRNGVTDNGYSTSSTYC